MKHLLSLVLLLTASCGTLGTDLAKVNQTLIDATTSRPGRTSSRPSKVRKNTSAADRRNELLGRGSPQPSETSVQSSQHCCINGAFYDCPSAAAVSTCLGDPMGLVGCVQSCGMMDSSCEERCIGTHGPRPEQSSCQRSASHDSECKHWPTGQIVPKGPAG